MTRTRRLARKASTALVGCLAAAALLAPAAEAAFELQEFEVANSREGQPSRQAGEHADLRTKFRFPNEPTTGRPDDEVKDIRVDLPQGFVGDPSTTPKCAYEGLIAGTFANCPGASQLGIARVSLAQGVENPNGLTITGGLYNIAHGPDVPALFGLNVLNTPVLIRPQVRPGDYGISALSVRTTQAGSVMGADITFWGVPGDSSHDSERQGWGPPPSLRVPLMRNPTSCPAAAQPFSIDVNTWRFPDVSLKRTVNADPDGSPFLIRGCERLSFEPTFEASSESSRAASPTGLSVDVTVPQNEGPDGLATADVRKTKVTFPEGFAVSSSAASGQGSCALSEIKLGSHDAPTCPDSSKIGTVEIETPLLEETLQGDVILAKQNDNPFNSLLALYLAVKGPGFYLKLPGRVDLDPSTGRVTSTFDNTPQLPFEHLRLRLEGGTRAPLVTPDSCGNYAADVEITSWASDAPVSLKAPMAISSGCATGGFSPVLDAGTDSPAAGQHSPFSLRITRQDGEQNLARIQATLPEGLLAKLKGVALCPEAAAASGSCPAASQVGRTVIGAGAGPTPLFVPEPGKAPTAVYLAGPYKSAPYSLVVKVPAQAGPFDLGTVTVRNALEINRTTAQVTASSDPLPQILQGIPVSYRDVRVEVDRPGFTLNPTSCEPMAVSSTLTSSRGATATPSSRYQAAGCAGLAFAPKLALRFFGKTTRNSHPRLRATLKAAPGQANIAKAVVTMPKSEFLENAHIQTICTRPQFAARNCPKGSIYGRAKAITPLLDQPLQGNVYLRANGGERELPDLVADLRGQIDIELVGYIDSVNSRLRTRFVSVPDAPVSKFVLEMKGGKKGLLVHNTDVCKTRPRATVKLDGQNGKVHDFQPLVRTDCGKAKAKKRGGKR
ncbi:MAG TPA: hypothetical protein VD761_00345 [Solirubrobacterales bacterium]|nr:hypothetical protein [Solirubrobacterales bacterium]